jgi:hypothetical protein
MALVTVLITLCMTLGKLVNLCGIQAFICNIRDNNNLS